MTTPLTPIVLMRPALVEDDEQAAIRAHFPVCTLRTQVPEGSLVIGRYAFLPFYDELEADLANLGSRPINSLAQHRYIAEMGYYEDLADVTFATWFRYEDVPHALRSGPFVVKGRTNSRKFEWHQKMYAPNFQAAVRIGAELSCDGLIGQQGVVIRQFVPLEVFETSVSGVPLANEWRIFYWRGARLAYGYYWGNIDDWAPVERARADFEAHGLPFADAVAARIADKAPFVVIDIARTAEGRWVVVELNDASQAGLNGTVDPQALFGALARSLARDSAQK